MGQKILGAAEADGISPQELCDKLVDEAWKPL
jgi:methionyl-tRNA synthetase